MRRVLQALEQKAITATKAEVDQLISQASDGIQAYIEDNASLTQLKKSIVLLDKASNTLNMMQIHGGVLLVEEVLKVLEMLVDGSAARVEEAQDVVSRAILSLSEYLDHVEAGYKDVPLVLMPLLNDLRAARDAALLSENVLFFPNIDGISPPDITLHGNEQASESWLRLIRSNYQKTLLACVSGKDIPIAAAQLCKLLIRLQRTSTSDQARKLWWLGSALAQAVAINALQFNASIASLFNALDRSIKSLIANGEPGFSRSIDDNIIKNILYYIAISDDRGRIVNQVKEVFRLNDQIPRQNDIDKAREQISAPTSEVLITVSKALLEDLASAKDCIELFMHSGMQEAKHIDRLEILIQGISDTLSMIGIEEYKTKAQHQLHEIELLKSDQHADSELVLLGVSEVILEIETCINNFIDYRINFQNSETGNQEKDKRFNSEQDGHEHKAAFNVTISEVLLRVDQTKELLTDVIHVAYDSEKVVGCTRNLQEISGVISVIDLIPPNRLIEGISGYISSDQFKEDIEKQADVLEDLADCVVGLQCYFEQLEARVPYADQILEHCQQAVLRISHNHDIDESPDHEISRDKKETSLDHDFEMTMVKEMESISTGIDLSIDVDEKDDEDGGEHISELDLLPDLNLLSGELSEPYVDETFSRNNEKPVIDQTDSGASDSLSDQHNESNETSALKSCPLSLGSNDLSVLTGEADPLLVETFIDEAQQVALDMSDAWNKWKQDTVDWTTFAEMRRAYHTLKGSGRFVGAELISEFGWQFENLCNKCLGKKEVLSEKITQMLEQGVKHVPALVEQLKSPQKAINDQIIELIEQVKDAASAFSEETFASKESPQSVPELDDNSKEEESKDSLQQELTGIFTVEATQHLKAMREAVGQNNDLEAKIRIDEELLRLVHTMRGSAGTAGIKHIYDLCKPLEGIIQLAITHDIEFDEKQIQLIQSTVKQLDDDLKNIENAVSLNEPDFGLIEQLSSLQQQLFDEHAQASGETEQSHMVSISPSVTTNDSTDSLVDYAQDRDDELCEIFYEEAEDLLLECQSSLQALMSESSADNTAISELQRKFHTLKGSSRMAGLITIGELSHVTETLLLAVSNQEVDIKQAGVLLQRVLDRLYADIEKAQSSQDLHLDTQLIYELKKICVKGENRLGTDLNTASDHKDLNIIDSDLTPHHLPDDINNSCVEKKNDEVVNPAQDLVPDEDEKTPHDHIQQSLTGEMNIDAQQASYDLAADNEQKQPLKKFIKVSDENPDENANLPEKQELVRVKAEVLDGLVNDAGEVNIQRSRLEQVFNAFGSNSMEFEQTIGRLREQLRKLDMETEAQILFKHADDQENIADFDPLELDRYSDIQQLSRSIAESVDDLSNIREMFVNNIQDAEDVLVNQKVVTTHLQDSLLSTRMIRFDSVEQRLQRIIRQTSGELNKQVELLVEGGSIEIDRRVLNGIITSIEHILRNSVSHGIELSDERLALEKPACGQIKIEIEREGSEISITIKDDGAGIDAEKVKAKAIENGIVNSNAVVSDEDALQLIFKPGLSTAKEVSKIAGRGVGMEIVEKDVRRLGGSVEVRSVIGKGTKMILKMPFTLAVSHALLVRAGMEVYALTLSGIEGVIQLSASQLTDIFSQTEPRYTYAGHDYSFYHLASLLKTGNLGYEDESTAYPVILVRMGDQRIALQVEATLGNKEIVVKPLAQHFSHSQGITGATILGDGNVALILDIPWLVRLIQAQTNDHALNIATLSKNKGDDETTVMVVDDSITIRKVTTRFLERNHYKVVTAKDGLDALQKLQKIVPDVVLLDIEMPRMDGYELAAQMRKEQRLAEIPIIMITSRTGDKHRARAFELGVNCYLGKPYNEDQLLDSIQGF